MKNHLFLISFIFSSLQIFAQVPKYQTYSANLLVIATKDNISTQWQNKNINVNLNYKDGDIIIVINNDDFYNKTTDNWVNGDSISGNRQYIIEGNLPIINIINQKTINQDYNVELQLTNKEVSLSDIINFKMNIMRPNQNAGSYRVFTLTGILYNDELKLKAFQGYDNKVEIQIIFNAFWDVP